MITYHRRNRRHLCVIDRATWPRRRTRCYQKVQDRLAINNNNNIIING